MRHADVVTYFSQLLKQSGIDTDENFIKTCVNLGFSSFWNARFWKFRTKSAPLSLDGSETYDLPNDFAAFRSIREKDSLTGWDLQYYDKVDFDREWPKLSAYATDKPRIYSVYRDSDTWKITFFPIPTTMTVYLDYYRQTPSLIDELDDQYLRGLFAMIERYLYKAGSEERVQAWQLAQQEIVDLSRQQGPTGDIGSKMLTEADIPMKADIPWVPRTT